MVDEWIDVVIEEQTGFLKALEFIRETGAHSTPDGLAVAERALEDKRELPGSWLRGAQLAIALAWSKY